jgi:hypothetical protein
VSSAFHTSTRENDGKTRLAYTSQCNGAARNCENLDKAENKTNILSFFSMAKKLSCQVLGKKIYDMIPPLNRALLLRNLLLM